MEKSAATAPALQASAVVSHSAHRWVTTAQRTSAFVATATDVPGHRNAATGRVPTQNQTRCIAETAQLSASKVRSAFSVDAHVTCFLNPAHQTTCAKTERAYRATQTSSAPV